MSFSFFCQSFDTDSAAVYKQSESTSKVFLDEYVHKIQKLASSHEENLSKPTPSSPLLEGATSSSTSNGPGNLPQYQSDKPISFSAAKTSDSNSNYYNADIDDKTKPKPFTRHMLAQPPPPPPLPIVPVDGGLGPVDDSSKERVSSNSVESSETTWSARLYWSNDVLKSSLDHSSACSAFYLYELSSQRLLYSGSLCSESLLNINKECKLHLDDGVYIWRVETCASYDKSTLLWEVCGESGYASTQLAFSVEHGKCKAIKTSGLTDLCSEEVSIAKSKKEVEISNRVTYPIRILSGSISLTSNGDSNSQNDHPYHAQIETALRDSLRMEIVASNLVSSLNLDDVTVQLAKKDHQLNIRTNIYMIRIRCGLSKPVVEDRWLHSMRSHLQESISTGFFLSRIMNHAKKYNNIDIQDVNTIELLTLEFENDGRETYSLSHMSTYVVIAGGAVGIIAFILILSTIIFPTWKALFTSSQQLEPSATHLPGFVPQVSIHSNAFRTASGQSKLPI